MQLTAKISPHLSLVNEEIEYPAEHILTSATDLRGIIRYTSPVFRDVAQFTADDLAGAAHKIVRHPDMPRGVFYLIWDRLKAGLPICTYIKNRAADGRYYWVFAMMTQMRDGYLSVQIKPTADLFAATREIYNDLLFEETGGLPPESSARRLCASLKERGFRNFDTYMNTALDAEFGRRPDSSGIDTATLDSINDLSGLIERAETLVENISKVFGQVRGEPVNLRILAGRLEEAGDVIGTISKNYETMAADMCHLVERLNDSEAGVLIRMRDAIDRGRCAAQIAALVQRSMSQANEAGHAIPPGQATMPNDACRTAMTEVIALGQTVPDTCRQLRRRINGLDLVKLLCRVESGRMGDVDNGMNGIITRLEEAHQSTDRHLSELIATVSQINSRSKVL